MEFKALLRFALAGDVKGNSGCEREQDGESAPDSNTCLRHWIIGQAVVVFDFDMRCVTENDVGGQVQRPKELPL